MHMGIIFKLPCLALHSSHCFCCFSYHDHIVPGGVAGYRSTYSKTNSICFAFSNYHDYVLGVVVTNNLFNLVSDQFGVLCVIILAVSLFNLVLPI